MTMNKQTGNMYKFVTHTWNPIRGKCPHNCSYCYMKKFNVGEFRLDEKELSTNLGSNNTIFVGSSTDMWIAPYAWIEKVIMKCNEHPNNTYLFQTKNPEKIIDFRDSWGKFGVDIPKNSLLGTTIETNRDNDVSSAPSPSRRAAFMIAIGDRDTFVSIEPIMDFDLEIFVSMIKKIQPKFVSIGADSQHNSLPEPSPEKVNELIKRLSEFAEVRIKTNLSRIVPKSHNL